MLKKRMQSWSLVLLFGGIAWSPLVVYAEPARWNLDPEHSTIEFRVVHMVVSKTAGRFTDYAGYIDMDAEPGAVTAVEATIKAASVNTNHEKRDTHIRTADFLDVEHYPTMTFKMKSYKKTAENFVMVGDFTLRGVTKEVTLAGRYNGATKDPWAIPGLVLAPKGNSTGKISVWSGIRPWIAAGLSSATRFRYDSI